MPSTTSGPDLRCGAFAIEIAAQPRLVPHTGLAAQRPLNLNLNLNPDPSPLTLQSITLPTARSRPSRSRTYRMKV